MRKDQFGLENRKQKEDIEQVVSRIDGEFRGWSGGTIFKLENGQVWKQIQSGRQGYRAHRPVVTIKRGYLGSFLLQVEGLNQRVRVKRIK